MADDPIRHSRRSIRLKNFDYNQAGGYFVTICTLNRFHFFSEEIDGEMRLNANGRFVRKTWDDLSQHYTNIKLDAFVVMPNHIHAVILIEERDVGADPCVRPKIGQPQGVAPTFSLPEVIHRFKSLTTKRYMDGVKCSRWSPFTGRLWQRNYWEHVIRDERSLQAIHRYIRENPQRLDLDRYNANAMGTDPWANALWQTLKTCARQPGDADPSG